MTSVGGGTRMRGGEGMPVVHGRRAWRPDPITAGAAGTELCTLILCSCMIELVPWE